MGRRKKIEEPTEEKKTVVENKDKTEKKKYNRIDNLGKNKHRISTEEASKGGKKSAYVRKMKKTMKDMLEQLVLSSNSDPKIAENLKKIGFDGDENVHMAKMLTALVKSAEQGDLKAIDMVNKMIYGDQSALKVDLSGSVENVQRVQIYLPEIEKVEE